MRLSIVFPVVALAVLAACTNQPHKTVPHAARVNDVVSKASKPFMAMDVTTTTIADNITVISGVGGNVLAITGNDGTILLDAGVAPRAEMLDAALADLDAKPVTAVVNTHYHFDHTGGDAYFAKKGAKIYAQVNVKRRLSGPQTIAFFGLTFPAAPRLALPSVTYNNAYLLHAGASTLELRHPPKPAHTDGDSYIKVREANVLFAGDLFFNRLYPFIDYGVGGSADGMIAADDELLVASDDHTQIVPGHGDVATKADLAAFRQMLVTVNQRIKALVAQGKSEKQVVAAKPTADFDAVWGHGLFSGEQFTRMVYRGIVHKH